MYRQNLRFLREFITYLIEIQPTFSAWGISRVVDILDLVLVSRHFGERSELAAPTLTTLLTSPPAPLLPGEGRESEYGTTSARIWLEPIAGGFKEAGELLRASLKVNVTGGEIYGGKFDFITSPAGQPQGIATTRTASTKLSIFTAAPA